MRTSLPRLPALLVLLALPPSAQADDLTLSLDGTFCFARGSAAVRRGASPALALRPAPADWPRAAGQVALEVSTETAGEALVAYAVCTPGEGRLDCLMEGDAGAFSVTLDGADLVVWPGPEGLGFEGAEAFHVWGEGGHTATLAACAS